MIWEMLIVLQSTDINTKHDIDGTANLVVVEEGDEYKMVFWMRYWLIEPILMLFGTPNALDDTEGYINNAICNA